MSIQCNRIFPSFIWFWVQCKREEVVHYLKTQRKDEIGQPHGLFTSISWSAYLNEMRWWWSYHIRCDFEMYNIQIQVISSLGLQATVDINQENGQQKIGFETLYRRARWPLCMPKIHDKFYLFRIQIWPISDNDTAFCCTFNNRNFSFSRF